MPNAGIPETDFRFERVFPRVHARALGIAIGVTTGGALLLLTLFHVIFRPGPPLVLLRQYFYGYDVTWRGAVVGAAWGFAAGFVGGWLLGLVHSLTLDIWLLVVRQRTNLSMKRNFLDQLK